MKNVLIVDDEESFLASLAAGLREYSADFFVLTANDGRKAVQVLESATVDLVVSDIRMPEMDGFELLAYMSTNFPSIPAIVMSAYWSPVVKERLETMGTLRFLEKPVDFQELAEAILEGLKPDFKGGSLKGISLAGFLQLIEMEQKTCLLEVYSEEGDKGFFYFNKGSLYDAICDANRGEQAALEMIGWDRVEINFKDLPKKKVKQRIESEIISLLMEGMRLKDELTEQEEESLREPEHITYMSATDLLPEEKEDGGERAPLALKSMEVSELEAPIDLNENGDVQINQRTSTDILQEIREIAGVSAVVLVARDGFIIESDGTLGDIDMDMLGASVGIVLDGAERVRHGLDLAEFQGLTLESDDAMIMCTPVGDALLVILAPDSKKLGMIRLRIKKQVPELAQLF
jgi:CheY-like chemotaxis protein/predicted regulator of Ras-like GTPase activity (Roadblock/LC7/MglB family)